MRRSLTGGGGLLRTWISGGVIGATLGGAMYFVAEQIQKLPSASASGQTIALGKAVYSENCASCHGADLEGQPNWRESLPSGRLPAPPHDETGHTWHHPDRVLVEIVKKGTAAVVGGGYETDMPGFEGILTDNEISAVLAFIKSRWPERERDHQERLTRADQQHKK